MLLLYPPSAKPSEPPAGIVQLAGTLLANNQQCTVADLNLEGLLYLVSRNSPKEDNWTKRAYRNRSVNLQQIRSAPLYNNFTRYQKCVLELNRLLEVRGGIQGTASLANYQDKDLSPLSSENLLQVANSPQRSLFYPFFMKRLPVLLAQTSPRYVGLSINYLSQALNSFSLIGCLRELAPDVKIIAGGGLITSWMRSTTWRNPFKGLIDYCIDGCGELPLLTLLGCSPSGQSAVPRYDLLPNADYFAPGFILPYSTSSGCYWNKCSFCPERAEKTPFSRKTEGNVLHDIALLKKNTSPLLLHFLDNAIPPSLLARFTEDVPGLPWYGFIRVSEHLRDRDFCRNLRKSGCVMLKLGIESGDQNVLERMEKGIDLTLVARVLANLKEAGIATYVYLLFGTPAESSKEAEKTLQFTLKHHREISFLNLAIFNMPVNIAEQSDLQTSSFYAGDLSLYTDFAHPAGWNRKEVRTFLDKRFKKEPAITAILKRDPPIFSSNHAPFFCNAFCFTQ